MKTGLATAVIAFASALMVQAAAAEPVVLKFSSFEPPQAFGPAKVYTPWIEAVEEASEGTLKIELYTGGSLGKPTAQLQIVENGVADISQIVPSFTPGRFEMNDIGELPFQWTDPRVASIAVWNLIDQGLLKYPSVKVLSATMTGSYQLHSDKPIATIEDVDGLKLRAAGPVFSDIVQSLGGVPVGIPTPSVAENVSRGVLDGGMNDWTLVESFRILDVTNHHFEYPLGGVIAILGMNQERYDSLPEKAKAAIDKYSGPYYANLWGEIVNAETQRIISEVEASPDHTIVRPDAEEYARWEEALKPVVDRWTAQSPEHAELLEAFQAELKKAGSESGQ